MGQFDKAIPLFEDLVKDRKTWPAMQTLGLAYKDAGRLEEAIKVLEEAAAKGDMQRVRRDLLDIYTLAGEHAKFVPLCREQLGEDQKARPTAVPNTDLLTRLGRAYLAQKKWSEAEPCLRECVAIWERRPDDFWMKCDAQSLLGESLLGQKKYAEAEPLLLKGYEGLKEREKLLGPRDALRVPEALDRVIELYTATNKPDEAKKWQTVRAKYPDAKPTEKK
jgi:tetratricopeptide (TPR) repeat protein